MITENDSEIEFIVTNLTDYHLQFDLVQNNVSLSDINALEPLKTIIIGSDSKFIANNKKITLKEKLEHRSLFSDIMITTNPQDQSKNHNQVRKLFEKTFWKSVDMFLLKSKKYNNDDMIPPRPRFIVSPWSNNLPVPSLDIQNNDDNYSDSNSNNLDNIANTRLIGVNTISTSLRNHTHCIENIDLLNGIIGSIVHNNNHKILKHVKMPTPENKFLKASTSFGIVLLQKNHIVKKNDNMMKSENVDALMTEYVNSRYMPLISNVYHSDQCVVCMDNDSDVIFYTCGHSCVCFTCSSKIILCPLCRNHISIVLNM